MKKKEIVIIVLLIVFGFIYNAVEKGKIKFIDDFSSYFNKKRLISEQYLEIPQKEKVFPKTNKIIIGNKAGEIIINKSSDGQTHLLSFFRIYFLNKDDVEKISRNAFVVSKIENNELNVTADCLPVFPYKRLRIRLQLSVPNGVELAISNHEGNVSIRNIGKNVHLIQENGSVILQDIASSVQVEVWRGDLSVKNIAENVTIDAKQTDISLENVATLNIHGKHGDYALKKIKGNVFIEHAYGDINLNDAEQAEILGRHSKLMVSNIKNGINITNAFENTFLANINGDVLLASRSGKIEIHHVNARSMVIENSFADINILNYSGETLNILLKNGNLDFQSKTVTGRLNIESKNANLNLALGALIDPTFNIKIKHGRIYNNLQIAFDIFADNDEKFANRIGQKPEIIVNNDYGDVHLK